MTMPSATPAARRRPAPSVRARGEPERTSNPVGVEQREGLIRSALIASFARIGRRRF
jgi:hypothetical protein